MSANPADNKFKEEIYKIDLNLVKVIKVLENEILNGLFLRPKKGNLISSNFVLI